MSVKEIYKGPRRADPKEIDAARAQVQSEPEKEKPAREERQFNSIALVQGVIQQLVDSTQAMTPEKWSERVRTETSGKDTSGRISKTHHM